MSRGSWPAAALGFILAGLAVVAVAGPVCEGDPALGGACDGNGDGCAAGRLVCDPTTDELVCEGDEPLGGACDGNGDQCASGRTACSASGDGVVCAGDVALGGACDGNGDQCASGRTACSASGDGVVCAGDEPLGGACDGNGDGCAAGRLACNPTNDGSVCAGDEPLGVACDDNGDGCAAGVLVCTATGDGIACEGDLAPDACPTPELGRLCTFTQGGWGSRCRGNNPGCVRDACFDAMQGGELVIGGAHTLTFAGSAEVASFLPAGGPPRALETSFDPPTRRTLANVLAGQVTALVLNVTCRQLGVMPGAGDDLARALIEEGPFAGLSVGEFLDIAERALGGEVGVLDERGVTFSEVSAMAALINESGGEACLPRESQP